MKHPLSNALTRLCRRIAPVALLLLGLAQPAWAALTVNGDATVSDSTTSLVWDQCPYGLTGATCATGTALLGTWAQALDASVAANAASYKGFSDWRVPNRNELASITKIDTYTAGQPAIDSTAFPGTPVNYFWTSTTYAPNPSGAWVVFFYNGNAGADVKTDTVNVRLVRSGQSFASFDSLALASQTITGFSPASPVAFGAAPATLSATGGASGNAIVFATTSAASICTVSGSTVTFAGVGTCNLTANQAGNASYSAAPRVTASIVITAASQTITGFSPASPAVFGAAPAALSATGGASGQSIVYATTSAASICTVSGSTVTFTGVGVCNLTADQAGNANYNAAPQVTASIAITSRSASGTSPAGGTITAAFSGGNGTCSYATTAFTNPSASTGVSFVHGVFSFTTTDCGAGATLNFTLTYPQVLPAGAKYYKYGPEFGGSQTPHWYVLPGAVIHGNQITFSITDNGQGDSNPAAGFITDPGGPGVPMGAGVTPPTTPTIDVLGMSPQCQLTARPTIVNLASGEGPAFATDMTTILTTTLLQSLAYVEQTVCGAVDLGGYNGGKLAFVPHTFQTGDTRANGIYALGDGRYQLVRGGQSLTIVPAVVRLEQLLALLPGVSASLGDNGVITASVGGLTYAVQPSVAVQLDPATGSAHLTMGGDGYWHFIDALGNNQILYPAFASPVMLRNALLGLDANATLAIQLDGTASIVLKGQHYTLVPDPTLGRVPAERVGQYWWQESATRFWVTNAQPLGTAQGFTVRQ